MANRIPKVTRGLIDDHSDELISAAKRLRKIKKKLDKKADLYLEGKLDPGKEVRKAAFKGATTAVVIASLLTGTSFSDPADIAQDQEAANYRPVPIVMDASDFVNAPVEDDDEEASDEQKGAKSGVVSRFRQAVLSMPQSVRIIIITPLWLIGTALMTAVSVLWNTLFASPLGAFIASFALGFALLTGLFTATAKMLFPNLPVRRILRGPNILILGCAALVLSVLDAAAPLYWNKYPLAAALLKLVLGGTVVGVLSVRTHKAFGKLKSLGI